MRGVHQLNKRLRSCLDDRRDIACEVRSRIVVPIDLEACYPTGQWTSLEARRVARPEILSRTRFDLPWITVWCARCHRPRSSWAGKPSLASCGPGGAMVPGV